MKRKELKRAIKREEIREDKEEKWQDERENAEEEEEEDMQRFNVNSRGICRDR